jgi:hypothetical protein
MYGRQLVLWPRVPALLAVLERHPASQLRSRFPPGRARVMLIQGSAPPAP